MTVDRLTRFASTAVFVIALAAGWAGQAGAVVKLNSPQLPPEPEPPDCDKVVSHYVGIDVHALFPSGIDFSNPRHYCFRNVGVEPDPGTGDEFEFFDSLVEGTFDTGSGPQVVELSGPVQAVVYGKGPDTTGTWQTEILSMDLSGDVGGLPIQVREDLIQPSVGQTSVAELNARWHRSIYDASGSSYLNEFIARLWTALPVRAIWLTSRAPRSISEHADIMAAIESRDGAAAAELMRAHVAFGAVSTGERLRAIGARG